MISNAIADRQFDSFGGGQRPTTYRRVNDAHQNKSTQLQEFKDQGIDINELFLLKNSRNRFLILNNGSLLYYK